jgi:hypothetical protein
MLLLLIFIGSVIRKGDTLMDMILDKPNEPGFEDICRYISGSAGARWRALTSHIKESYSSKPLISYSVCAGKPGWNVKYKKGGKALCTLYPEKDGFIALVVLAAADMDVFEAVRGDYTPYLVSLYENCKPFNNTKWLMINVSGGDVLEDVKRLLRLKASKK